MGLGCMGMSEFYGPGDEQESIATIHRAWNSESISRYRRHIWPFKNEELVGKAIRGRRDRVVLATKFGIVRDPANPQARGFNGKPDYVRNPARPACGGSVWIPSIFTTSTAWTPTRQSKKPSARWRNSKEGKVRYLGLSEAGPETIRRAAKVHPITALQTEYSLWSRDPEEDNLSTCRELGIGFVAYSPLGRGFLSGQITKLEELPADDYRRISPCFQGENLERNLELVRRLEEIAKEKNCKPSQLALAWILAQGEDIIPIPGTKRRKYLEENAAAATRA